MRIKESFFEGGGLIQWMGEAKAGIKPMVVIECRGEPYVRPRTKTSIEPMVENIYKSFAFGA